MHAARSSSALPPTLPPTRIRAAGPAMEALLLLGFGLLLSSPPTAATVTGAGDSSSASAQPLTQPQASGHPFPRLANCWGAGELCVSAEQWEYLGFPNVTNDTWADYDLQYINPGADWRPAVIPDWVQTIKAIKRRNPKSVVVGTFHTTEVWYRDMVRNGSGQGYLPRVNSP